MSTDTVKVDDLTLVYMTNGACNNTKYLEKARDIVGEGELEYLNHVIELAGGVEEEFVRLNTNGSYYGCFAYEVAEPIGEWITEQTILNDAMPSKEDVVAMAARLISQHIDD